MGRNYVAYDKGFSLTDEVAQEPHTWFHLSLVLHGSGSGISIYMDGRWVGEKGWTAKEHSSGSGMVGIGALYTIERLHYFGSVTVDELTMWNRELTSEEIKKIYQN